MDEFVVFLVAGLMIIAVLFVLFGQQPAIISPIKNVTTTTTIPRIPEVTLNLVGPKSVQVWRSVDLGEINVSYGSKETKNEITDKYLFNGLLFGSNRLDINFTVDTKNLVGAYLRFDVTKANNYGSLIVKVNDEIIKQGGFSVGEYQFLINKSIIKQDNKIEIIPTSSAWKIWAPTVYELSNIEFGYQSLSSKADKIYFNIYEDEFNNLAEIDGRIVLDLTEHKGKLNAVLNGNEIFFNETRSYQTIYFDQDILRLGSNSIEFVAETEGLFQGNVNLIFYYTTIQENYVEKVFSINQSEYKELNKNPGMIKFNITDILEQGGLSLTIQDATQKLYQIGYDTVRKGNYTYKFNTTQCSVGYNTLRIKSVDNSVFYIRDLEIVT